MNTPHSRICPTLTLALAAAALLVGATALRAQNTFIAYDLLTPTNGNQGKPGLSVGNDFYVVDPIIVWKLGVFDHLGDGIIGNAALTVQLYSRRGNSGSLLDSVAFDATSPGELFGGHRFKALPVPLTLLPGAYSVAAYGFDAVNLEGNWGGWRHASNQPPPWTMNDGNGLLRFEGASRFGYAGLNYFPDHSDNGPANRYAAGTFAFSAATLPPVPYAADYAALVQGVSNFHLDGDLGSLAVFGRGAFPVIVEPGSQRLVFEAAGAYEGKPDGSRCVVFAHTHFASATNSGTVGLFDNAILWAGRKGTRAATMVGVGPGLDPVRIASLGYGVKVVTTNMATAETDLSGCDVFAVDWHGGDTNDVQQVAFTADAVAQIATFNLAGGGLVMVVTPWAISYPQATPGFVNANLLLDPFGLALRNSQNGPVDSGYTNIFSQPWPRCFSAFPAADLLAQDRQGQIRLSGLEKSIALGTINYTLTARPDLLSALMSAYSGRTADVATGPAGSFADVVVLTGSQAATNRLGKWVQDGPDLVAQDRRGAVAYEFNVVAADVFGLRIEGAQGNPASAAREFDLMLAIDGLDIGRQQLLVETNGLGSVECLTPYLRAGPHTLRIFWDNAASDTALRLKAIRLQTGFGPDSDGDGIKDWVQSWLKSESAVEICNGLPVSNWLDTSGPAGTTAPVPVLTSYVSPACVEGRALYPACMRLWLAGPSDQANTLAAQPAPDDRWYADVPLRIDPDQTVTLNAAFENGARTEMWQVRWTPFNLLLDNSITIRQGDSLLLAALPSPGASGDVVITVGTNQFKPLNALPMPYQFGEAGLFTVTGTFTPRDAGAAPQSRSITVKVVGYRFPEDPVCWAGHERMWDLTNLPPEVVFESDTRLMLEEIATLGENGRRLGLLIEDNQPRYILSRLGDGGPILSSAKVTGLELASSAETYLQVVDTYPDGTRLVETVVVVDPLPPGVIIQLDIFVGGVTFEDGTTTLRLTAADFDRLGQCKVRFLWPAGTQTSVCHTVTVYQGDEIVGTRGK
jgi:hypothetical protein